jgi:hypothetical protein
MTLVLNVFHELRIVNMETNIFENIAEFIMLIAWTAKEIMMQDIFDSPIGPPFGWYAIGPALENGKIYCAVEKKEGKGGQKMTISRMMKTRDEYKEFHLKLCFLFRRISLSEDHLP